MSFVKHRGRDLSLPRRAGGSWSGDGSCRGESDMRWSPGVGRLGGVCQVGSHDDYHAAGAPADRGGGVVRPGVESALHRRPRRANFAPRAAALGGERHGQTANKAHGIA